MDLVTLNDVLTFNCLANSYLYLIHVLNWTETVWYAADAAAAARVSKDLQDSRTYRISVLFFPFSLF